MTTGAVTVEELLDKLYFRADNEREKGDLFERFVRKFLLTEPMYADRFEEVWMWNDWPGRGTRPDTGIDLVARERDGRLCAVQCKFFDPERAIAKPQIDSFLAASGTIEFDSRLIVSTTEKWNRNAERAIREQRVPVNRIGLTDLVESTIDWSIFDFSTPEIMERKGRKILLRHQRTAVDAVIEGFTDHDRGKLVMACGTGKTLTSLKLAENVAGKGGRVLFLVPSIALLSQTLKEWTAESEIGVTPFAVCSDTKVGKGKGGEGEDISIVDLMMPATTDPKRLAQGLARANRESADTMTVVFATYQSIDVVHQAQGIDDDILGMPLGGADPCEFNLIICDEAHRTTGVTLAEDDESAFVRVHDNNYLKAAKRLYMTATPRIYDDNSKARADQTNAVLASMDDETVYGPEFHRLGFGEAVERDLLSDYKVIVLTVDEGAVSRTMQTSLADFDGQLNLPDVARIVGCWNGLSKRAVDGSFGTDNAPMQTAVAFARDIKTSKRFAEAFERVVEDYLEASRLGGAPIDEPRPADVHHVDGGMNILTRNAEIDWLKMRTNGECRVLSNARCLAEGVDVPALDAVIFLNPRKSQVDIVQSVGRVMRKAPGKKYGYIILPVAIPAGASPEEALADNERFRVVWEVLQALRAHDERFDAMVNKIELNRTKPDKLIFAMSSFGEDDGAESSSSGEEIVQQLPIDSLEEWREAIYARLVEKVGSRRYWESWAKDIAAIAGRHHTRLGELVKNPDVAGDFDRFVDGLRANLNESISKDSALEMLSQHMISKPVFDALFEGHDFALMNPVAKVMQQMLDRLEGVRLVSETVELEKFYDSVRLRCEGIDNAAGKQKVIKELYEKFFQMAFAKTAKSLGIVYTPIEVVDFIIRSVDTLLKEHFGRGLTDEGVHVLDPFTGTGTFIVRLLQSGLIAPEDLARKYACELHANEILLLAYYIAAANIEVAYQDIAAQAELDTADAPFEGIVLTDTFQMSEDGDRLDGGVFPGNSLRAAAQLELPIEVIIANPPYSVGQESANDNNANLKYPTLDGRIEATYAARSSATNKNSLYDSYIRALRWASDRIGEAGVIGFVTNGGFIDANTSDGLRLSLAEEFSDVYVFNLRGNARTAGELRRQEKDNVFGQGARTTVVVTFLVRAPGHSGPARIHYRDIGDYLRREDKLAIVEEARLDSLEWERITPNEQGDWINQRDPRFDTWQSIGGKDQEGGIFSLRTSGLKTNRDAWVYDFSEPYLRERMERMVDFYNSCATAMREPDELDPRRFSWNRADRAAVRRGTLYSFDSGRILTSSYRPFTCQHVYFDRSLNDMVYRLYEVFPTPEHENYGFSVMGPRPAADFAVLMGRTMPDVALFTYTIQFFPRWTWEKVDSTDEGGQGAFSFGGSDDFVLNGYRRVDNITDATLSEYRKAYGEVTKDDIFFYVYGLLHSPDYRTRYAADLKKMLPRIPRVADRADFDAFSGAGRALAELHMGYENVEAWPLEIEGEPEPSLMPEDPWALYRVEKMRYGKAPSGGGGADKTVIHYNPRITVRGIPERAHDYLLGSRSGIDWIVERYRIKTDKASGIVNDPNEWCKEVSNPRYILDLIAKVTTVSMRTLDIIDSLPELNVD